MTDEVWTIQKILTWTTQHLEKRVMSIHVFLQEWLLSAVTGLSHVQLYTNFDKPLSTDRRARMREAIKRRAGASRFST